jgi:starvation-inducible DNA-binding protein
MHNNKVDLVEKLSHLLSDLVTMKAIAHGYHWNVKGIEFTQMHELFQEIYEDLDGAIDPLGEDIRKLGYDSPYFLTDFVEMTCLGDQPRLSGDAVQMLESLLNLNKSVNACVLAAFETANACNEQGIANFLAERDDMHKKWSWYLRSSLGTF